MDVFFDFVFVSAPSAIFCSLIFGGWVIYLVCYCMHLNHIGGILCNLFGYELQFHRYRLLLGFECVILAADFLIYWGFSMAPDVFIYTSNEPS